MNLIFYNRIEFIDNYDQLIDDLTKHQSYTPTEISTTNIDNVKHLYKMFTDNPKLNRVIYILPNIYTNNKIPGNTLKHFILWVYTDNFVIEATMEDNSIFYNFSYILYNYHTADFLEHIKDSVFDDKYYGYERISKDIYFKIYKYYKEYINDPILEKSSHLETLEYEIKWDILKMYLLYNPDQVVNYISMFKYDISLLINTINLLYNTSNINIQYYDQLVMEWIVDYLNWYNEEGKKNIDTLRYASIIEDKYDVEYDLDHNLSLVNEMKKNNYFIDNHGIYQLIPKHYEYDIHKLINQLYYQLAQYHLNIENKTKDDIKDILNYLDLAGDYEDAKELKKKLFYEYIGLPFGEKYDIDLDNMTLGNIYELIKLIKQ